MQVAADDRVVYLNRLMARLLGIEDRSRVQSTPLAQWDSEPLGERFLAALVGAVRSSGEAMAKEVAFPGLAAERLPEHPGERPAGPPLLRFVAFPLRDGQVQVTGQEVTRLRWLERTFAQYVGPDVIQEMLVRSSDDFMRCDRREMSLLFIDLRGFTRVSEKLDPTQVLEMVNGYLQQMTTCVVRYGGMVDKYVGDEVMALFGAPVPTPDHTLRAIRCAIEMCRTHHRWRQERLAAGLPAPAVGVGVSSGEVVVGNVGSAERTSYTALGHTVNLAARLCGKAGEMEILIDQETYSEARRQQPHWSHPEPLERLRFDPGPALEMKNVSQPVPVARVRWQEEEA